MKTSKNLESSQIISNTFSKAGTSRKLMGLIALQAGLVCSGGMFSSYAFSDSFSKAFEEGTAAGNMRLRYETVDQDNTNKKASALTLRTKLNFTTGDISGFSGFAEFEDSRVVGSVDDYNNTQGSGSEFSVIADPETTELDQAYIKYKTDNFSTKLGRQVITMDNHRFVGHVGWRQDWQTFDALSFNYKPIEDLSLDYAFIDKRNRILAEAADIDSKDHILNASYDLSGTKLGAYVVNLEIDDADATIDTTGVKVSGSQTVSDTKLLYHAEFATQTNEAAGTEFDTDYMFLELGAVVSGITAKLGYEVLGSDEGKKGFATPLATLHKFNGWADVFLATPDLGLVDTYIALNTKVSGFGLGLVYHDYSADESSATVDDLGSELDLVVTKTFAKKYASGVKYAAFSAGDTGDTRVDTEKLWIWTSMSF